MPLRGRLASLTTRRRLIARAALRREESRGGHFGARISRAATIYTGEPFTSA